MVRIQLVRVAHLCILMLHMLISCQLVRACLTARDTPHTSSKHAGYPQKRAAKGNIQGQPARRDSDGAQETKGSSVPVGVGCDSSAVRTHASLTLRGKSNAHSIPSCDNASEGLQQLCRKEASSQTRCQHSTRHDLRPDDISFQVASMDDYHHWANVRSFYPSCLNCARAAVLKY
jgi:hypothetical protein